MENIAIKAAAALAASAHKDQKYGDEPYTVHLGHVFEVLKRFGCDDQDILVAAWLHDIVEDTDVELSQIELMFGKAVSDLVWRVTNEAGKNRKERHAKTYPKIQESERATTLKLADRIANTEKSIEDGDDILQMYEKEYSSFREAMYKSGQNEAMWRHLDFLMGEGRSGAW